MTDHGKDLAIGVTASQGATSPFLALSAAPRGGRWWDHRPQMRLSICLRDAALRHSLETLAMETALHLHYREHPHAQPSLADIALALAVQDGSPLAERPDLLAAAASAVVKRRPNADADDVLLWAEAQLAVSA